MPKKNAVKSKQPYEASSSEPAPDEEGVNSREKYSSSRLTHEELTEIINGIGSETIKVGPSKSAILYCVAEKQRAKEAKCMNLSDVETVQRDQVTNLVRRLDFRGKPDEFNEAQLALNDWRKRHPDDPKLDTLTKIYETMRKGADLLK